MPQVINIGKYTLITDYGLDRLDIHDFALGERIKVPVKDFEKMLDAYYKKEMCSGN